MSSNYKQNIFVMPAAIGSDVWIVNGKKIEYGVIDGYKITAHGAYCYGSISVPRDDDPEERIWEREFGVHVNDFGKTVFLGLNEAKLALSQDESTVISTDDDATLCAGCLSSSCDRCPKDDGYRCYGCPCDNCKVVDGKRTNWYDSYTERYGAC